MNAVLQFLDKVERRGLGTEDRGEDGQKAKSSIRSISAETIRPSFSFRLRIIRPAAYSSKTKSSTSIGVSLRIHANKVSFLEPSAQIAAMTEDRFSPRSPSVV